MKTKRANDTKQAILDAAVKLVEEKGYAETSILDICKECGITKPTFYYYYKSKEDIFEDFDFHYLQMPGYSATPQILRAENAWQQLWIMSKNAVDQFTLVYGKPVLLAAMAAGICKGKNPFMSVPDDVMDTIVPFVERAQREGIIRSRKGARELMERSNLVFVGTIYMWVTNELKGDIYQEIYDSMRIILDIDPKYDFSIEMYK